MKTKAKQRGRRKGKRDRQHRRRVRAKLHALTEARPWYVGKPLISPLVEDHSDDRGRFAVVENVSTFGHPIGAVAVLTSKAGTVRAEHRHAKEGHTCMLVSGSATYRERNASGLIAPIPMLPFVPIFTPPDVDHAFEFTADSVMVVVANISRTRTEYEADVVRLKPEERLVQPPKVEEVPT